MRKEKQFLLDEIKVKLSESTSFVLTSYLRMDPNKTSDFRMSVVDSGGLFCVVKKRVFLKAAEELNTEPENCVVFEDSVAGIQAANNGKMKSIGIGDVEFLHEADHIFTDFTEISFDFIKGL